MDMDFGEPSQSIKKRKKKSKKGKRRNTDEEEDEPHVEMSQNLPSNVKSQGNKIKAQTAIEDSNSDANSSVDAMGPAQNKLSNVPYSMGANVEVKSMGMGHDIKCCMYFDLERGIRAMMVVTFIDFLYSLGYMFFGLLFNVVGKSKEVTVNESTSQLQIGNDAVNMVNKNAIGLLKKQQQLNLNNAESLKFGQILSCISFVSLFPLVYVMKTIGKHQLQEKEIDRQMIVYALDIWILKSTLWYLLATVAFIVIKLDQESNQLISLIITGIITFVMLFWWRTTFKDSLNSFESYKLKESLGTQEQRNYAAYRNEQNNKIKDREEGQHLEEYN